MVDFLSEDQIREFRDTFRFFDKKGKGYVSRDEFGSLMRMMGQCPDEDHLQTMLDDVDSKGTGEITFEQFLYAIAEKIRETESKEQLVELFRIFDEDGNGSISVDELKMVMHDLPCDKLTEDEVEGMIKQADSHGSGEIQFDDFIKLITAYKH